MTLAICHGDCGTSCPLSQQASLICLIMESGASESEYTIVVTRILGDLYYGINESGAYRTIDAKNAVKTGKHYDIQTILDSMTGVEK